jgi:hypothetical protein
VGVPDLEKAPIVVEMFERYSSGVHPDFKISEWLNGQGYLTAKNHPFNKDSARDMLRNPYYIDRSVIVG